MGITARALPLAVAFGVCLAGTARADITVEEARGVAEAASGVSLDDATLTTESSPPGGGGMVARFSVGGEPGGRTAYEVDLTDGRFLGFIKDCPSLGDDCTITEAAAIAAAQAVADQYLAEDAEGLVWTVSARANGEVELDGQRPYAGDPSRAGLTPSCSVSVGDDGVVTSLLIDAWDSVALEPAVTREQAVAIAEAETGAWPCTPIGGPPELIQEAGQLHWGMELLDSAGVGHLFHIDAQSGAVLRHNISDTKPLTPAQRARRDDRHARSLVLLWSATGGALVVLAGLVTVLLRRRR